MEYTHTFEIIMNGVNIQGEVQFGDGGAFFKTTANKETTIAQHGKVQQLLETFLQAAHACDEIIIKIELVKK